MSINHSKTLLKPMSVQHTYGYQCPICGAIFYQTGDYVDKIGKELCYCGNVLFLSSNSKKNFCNTEIATKQLCDVNDTQTTHKQIHNRKTNKSCSNTQIPSDILELAVSGLVNLGFKKKASKSLVITAFNKGWYNGNFDQFFQKVLTTL